MALFNESEATWIEEARERQRQVEAEAERQRNERQQTLKDREERLMMEFMGDEVRVRLRGFKTFTKYLVSHEEDGEGNYTIRFTYLVDADYGRSRRLTDMMRLDIRQGNRYYTLWDDGVDDLSRWDQSSVKPGRPLSANQEG